MPRQQEALRGQKEVQFYSEIQHLKQLQRSGALNGEGSLLENFLSFFPKFYGICTVPFFGHDYQYIILEDLVPSQIHENNQKHLYGNQTLTAELSPTKISKDSTEYSSLYI